MRSSYQLRAHTIGGVVDAQLHIKGNTATSWVKCNERSGIIIITLFGEECQLLALIINNGLLFLYYVHSFSLELFTDLSTLIQQVVLADLFSDKRKSVARFEMQELKLLMRETTGKISS